MRLVAFGGDERMRGALLAAEKAGWEALHVACEADVPPEIGHADAVLLPWPHSFRDERLVTAEPNRGLGRERVLSLLPPCRLILYGGGVQAEEMPQAEMQLNPQKDETFLRRNAQLTAEGALCAAMRRMPRALLGSTCMVTGFGRIGQELAVRLCAMGAFVIVCARNEEQMRLSHHMGAHPVPLRNVASAAAQANVIFNTVPAHVLDEEALSRVGEKAMIIELASAPYGEDLELAARLGVEVIVEGGLPGRYAPLDAGEALFDVARRYLKDGKKGESMHG